MNKIPFTKAAEAYINSKDFPIIGYPHLGKQDFIKGAECATNKALEWVVKNLSNQEKMISDFKNFMFNE